MHVDGVDLPVERSGDLHLHPQAPEQLAEALVLKGEQAASGVLQAAPAESPVVAGRRTRTRRSGAVIDVTPYAASVATSGAVMPRSLTGRLVLGTCSRVSSGPARLLLLTDAGVAAVAGRRHSLCGCGAWFARSGSCRLGVAGWLTRWLVRGACCCARRGGSAIWSLIGAIGLSRGSGRRSAMGTPWSVMTGWGLVCRTVSCGTRI